MKLLHILLLLMLAIICAACQSDSGIEGGPTPTRGPIQELHGSGDVTLELSASTNCVNVGENVYFKVRILNATTAPVTLTNTLDITIRAARPAISNEIVQQWSETNQYPEHLKTVLLPGEEIAYEWPWVGDRAYISEDLANNMIQVTTGIMAELPNDSMAKDVSLFLGVSAFRVGLGAVRCSEMPT